MFRGSATASNGFRLTTTTRRASSSSGSSVSTSVAGSQRVRETSPSFTAKPARCATHSRFVVRVRLIPVSSIGYQPILSVIGGY